VVLTADARPAGAACFSSPTDLAAWVQEITPEGGIVAVDAPLRTSEGLMLDAEYRSTLAPPPPAGRYLTYRVCDYELSRRGLPLYLVPHRYPDCPGWMRAGFAVYDALLQTRRWSLFEGDPRGNRLAEVYPFAAFAAMLGQYPPKKSTPAGRTARLEILARHLAPGAELHNLSHHELDAVAAALTARALRQGSATWVGSPREALIVLPGPLLDRYRPTREKATEQAGWGLSVELPPDTREHCM
jgi:predicted nuclease with RNAse H fold